MSNPIFSILITTKNRLEDLKVTLDYLKEILEQSTVECIICDDGSTDGTYEYVASNYPKIVVFRHENSKGLIASRNELLAMTKAQYAISLDDDAHFLTNNVLTSIQSYFQEHKCCGVMALRVFWGKETPSSTYTSQQPKQVNGYVGCGHVWRMETWRTIPNYLEWFQFYGEEQFAALQLAKTSWQIHYEPSILVHHRVDMKARTQNSDYLLRQRQSLRSGWYLYFLCMPKRLAFKLFVSSLWSQIKRKVLKGNLQATKAIVLAFFDLIKHSPKFFNEKYRLSVKEYDDFSKLPAAPIYWNIESDDNE